RRARAPGWRQGVVALGAAAAPPGPAPDPAQGWAASAAPPRSGIRAPGRAPGRREGPGQPASARHAAPAYAATGYGPTPGDAYPADRPAYGSSSNGHGGGHGSASTRPGSWEQQFGPPPQPATAPTSPAPPKAYDADTLSFSTDPLTAPLDTSASSTKSDRDDRSGDSTDDDLLIFSQANSAWFTASDGESKIDWDHLSSDEGWRAAEQVAEPTVGPETPAGLPRRVPLANLVPGSVTIG